MDTTIQRLPVSERPYDELEACALCRATRQGEDEPEWNRPLIETENFVVFPSLGALVEGWLLIVPKGHYLSIAAMPEGMAGEREKLKLAVGDLIRKVYGHVTFFEHGPAGTKTTTGCGVDHAHLHVVAAPEGVLEAAHRHLPPGVYFRTGTLEDCRAVITSGKDYLFYMSKGEMVFAEAEMFASQTFRKAIADVLGMEDRYDWKAHPGIENIHATIHAISSKLLERTLHRS